MITTHTLGLSLVLALNYPFCTANVKPTVPPWDAQLTQLWQSPDGVGEHALNQGRIPTRDLFYGPWGPERAPDPRAVYTFVERKPHDSNPAITVRDPNGHEWHVKQPRHADEGADGAIEVVLSRVLSAVGYHQPPVYFLPSLTVRDAHGTHVEAGGPFRLTDKSITAGDTWSWQQNPFVGMRPYQGLLVVLMMFGGSDIKNENNALYEVREPGAGPKQWYVVRDLGAALGETGRLSPQRPTPEIFERKPFILGVKDNVVQFNDYGRHQELLRQIDPLDVTFAVDLLQQLSDEQWHDAFRAGGYTSQAAGRFIAQLHQRIDEAIRVAGLRPMATSAAR